MIRALIALCALVAAPGIALADTVLITGANRGIGLEFARQYAAKGYTVIATARNPAEATELAALAAADKDVAVERLDVTDAASIAALAAKYRGKPIDVLINNAGVLGDLDKQKMGSLDKDTFQHVLTTNAFGAMAVTDALRENLLAGGQKKIVGISSHAGLVSAAGATHLFYRASKAALNIGLRSLGAEIGNGVIAAVIMPGAVDTDMIRLTPMAGRGVPVKDAVAKMIATIDRLTAELAKKPLNADGRQAADW